MALRIQPRSWKNRDGSTSKTWRLIVEDFSSGDRVCFYPKKTDYLRYGFNPDDSLEDALAKLEIVRAKNKLDRVAERRAKIDKRLATEALQESAFLPRGLYDDFLQWLQERRMWDTVPSKTESHLRCMRKLIIDLNSEPTEWSNRPEKVYRWFHTQKLSISYMEKVLPLLNAYGYFYSASLRRPFLEIPRPPADVMRRIEDANLNERDGKQAESRPLTPALLERLNSLPDPQLRWMRISLYFGLRPSEIDELTPENLSKLWSIHKDDKATPILAVYQAKLIKVARQRRWKRIPCILVLQRDLLTEIKASKPIWRPYAKTLQAHLGEGYGLYAGRKGFEKLMRENGQSFINISRWLGHQDIRRTEANYRETELVEYDPIEAE